MSFLRFWQHSQKRRQVSIRKRLARLGKERLQRIFLSSRGMAFFEWDARTNHLHWDGILWRDMGYSDREIKSISSPERLMDYAHADDLSKITEFNRMQIRLGVAGIADFRLRDKTGNYHWVQMRCASTKKENDNVIYTSGAMIDVSKEKQTEQELQEVEARHARIINASNDGIWEWEPKQGFQFSSRCWEHLGFPEGDDVINRETEDRIKVWRQRMHPEDLPLFDKALNDHFAGEAPFDVEYRVLRKPVPGQVGDRWCWIRARGKLSRAPDGKPLRMSGTNIDITSLKDAEAKVILAKDNAEKANLAKSQFLSNMSHELRTPLNAIIGFSQLFERDTSLNLQQRENISEINKAGKHLLHLVNDVLDLSSVESGSMQFKFETSPPTNLVKDCIKLVREDARLRGISMESELECDEGIYVVADIFRVKQVLLNLLSNAIKYNHDNGSVFIRCYRRDEKYLQFSVKDTGIGIANKDFDRVFEPFKRLSAENSKTTGTGIGLTISKRFIEGMHGQMGFSSTLGQGSTFWFTLPIATAVVSSAEGHALGAGLKPYTSTAPDALALPLEQVKTILYVEDNIASQRLMREVMSSYDKINLVIASDAMSGFYEARSILPDVIIMDINLPGMSGLEAMEVIRKEPSTKHIPVLALSANAMSYDIEAGIKAGFYRYLTKPLDLEKLVSVLRVLLAAETP